MYIYVLLLYTLEVTIPYHKWVVHFSCVFLFADFSIFHLVESTIMYKQP